MILNNNHATTQLRATLKPIKKAIPTFFKTSVIDEAGRWFIPTHKIVMRVTDEFPTYGDEDLTAEEELKEAMLRNPYVTISFTNLSRVAPETVNADTLSEFITYLYENGFVPHDVEVALSPYNFSLNVVVVFDVEVYGEEPQPQAETPSIKPPRRINPLDYLTS
ncbi:hypothetical protein AB0O65_10775 [Microbacterium sp. NPDC077391]|uniref:hypothetical protein n=1 Tax=Microbacterium sp. NPDC077391 TaxID=3154765 RepID=UPI00343EAEDA